MQKQQQPPPTNALPWVPPPEPSYRIGFMHRTPLKTMVSDMVLATMTHAKYMHLDILFVPPEGTEHRSDIMKQLFSAYVGETFCAYTPQKWGERDNASHSMLLLDVTEDEYYKAREYVCDLKVNNVAYNYMDLALCGVPNSVAMAMAHDQSPYPLPKTVYCSQAAVLMLRHAISPGRRNAAIIWSLAKTNNRACSPSMLHSLLAPHCSHVDVPSYVRGGEIVSVSS